MQGCGSSCLFSLYTPTTNLLFTKRNQNEIRFSYHGTVPCPQMTRGNDAISRTLSAPPQQRRWVDVSTSVLLRVHLGEDWSAPPGAAAHRRRVFKSRVDCDCAGMQGRGFRLSRPFPTFATNEQLLPRGGEILRGRNH